MCDDGVPSSDLNGESRRSSFSRRTLLQAGVALAGAGVLVGREGWRAPAVAATTYDDLPGYSMAMHVHSSFSEFYGSMEAQLYQAQINSVNVLWWTDHDQRMEALNYRSVVHFTSLTNENTNGPPWLWQMQTSGSLMPSSTGGIAAIGAPHDPIRGSSLFLSAQSTSNSPATLGFYAQTVTPPSRAAENERANLYGQQWSIAVLPTSIGADGYLELRISSSYHLAHSGRPAGAYSLSYRFGGSGVPGTRSSDGLVGIVNVPVVTGKWNAVTITPCNDIAAIWPDMDYHDFSSAGITLNAVSAGLPVSGNFDYLRFFRQYTTGNIPFETQQAIGAGYAATFPGVTQRQGMEMGLEQPHINWFGGAISIPTYAGVTSETYEAYLQEQVVNCHTAGGLTSYNHPYGTTNPALLPQPTQDSMMSQVAATLLSNYALGSDILEVGYVHRAGVDLNHHVGLWDVLSRNALFLTGNGTNDDHGGTDWANVNSNNWVTWVWAPSTGEADLSNALGAGRAWTSSLNYPCSLDLLVDGVCPMGSVSVSSLPVRNLELFATGIPPGGSLQVLQGAVDYAGQAALVPNVTPIASFSSIPGAVSIPIDTATSSFLRTALLNSTGSVVAVSNPIWLLQQAPPGGIPPARNA